MLDNKKITNAKYQQHVNLLHIINKAVDSIRRKQLQIEPQWVPIFGLLCAQPVNNTWLV